MLDSIIHLIGNLVDNPDIRATPNGNHVCSFRLASTPRRFDRAENRWVDGTTLFLRVTCWRQLAENVSTSLARGDRAVVIGRLRQRSFETTQGERRTAYEVEADAVGAELAWHPIRFQRTARGAADSSAESVPAHSGVAQPGDVHPGMIESHVPPSSSVPAFPAVASAPAMSAPPVMSALPSGSGAAGLPVPSGSSAAVSVGLVPAGPADRPPAVDRGLDGRDDADRDPFAIRL